MVAPLVPQSSARIAPSPVAFYRIERPFWSWLGRRFHVYDASGAVIGFVNHPVLRLRDEFVIYEDEAQMRPLVLIKARQIVSFRMTYDVHCANSGVLLGTLRKRGFKSLVRDTWEILDASGQPTGVVEEQGLSLLRRLIPLLIGRWRIEYEGRDVGKIRQVFRFFIKEYTLELDTSRGGIDPRFGIACALLALIAETQREG